MNQNQPSNNRVCLSDIIQARKNCFRPFQDIAPADVHAIQCNFFTGVTYSYNSCSTRIGSSSSLIAGFAGISGLTAPVYSVIESLKYMSLSYAVLLLSAVICAITTVMSSCLPPVPR
mmetsp:Transcript_806/g.1240  ORF Transcript_806/g.1240 Transcript_806/m.1240 type:complete len:117 (+) Transcript_806:144-494(+)